MIHPTAIIHPKAQIGERVEIGPFCTVGEHVHLADEVKLVSHVAIDGHTKIGKGTQIFPFTTIGMVPQDLKFHGEESRVEIGENNNIREHVTIHAGTEGGGSLTKIGNNCLLMVGSHVAHDCILGNHIIMANNATLGGHVEVGDYAVFGGISAVHQHVRIGESAMIGGMSGAERDVLPFCMVMEKRIGLEGINYLGLKRRGFDKDEQHAMRGFFSFLQEEGVTEEKLKKLDPELLQSKAVQVAIDFASKPSKRGYLLPYKR